MSTLDIISANVKKHCSNLQSEDRRARKSALEALNQEFFCNGNFESVEVLSRVFSDYEKVIWKCLYDPAEAVRENAIQLIEELLKTLVPSHNLLNELIPILVWRLGDDVKEPSEEVRLHLVTLLDNTVLQYKELCTPYVEEIVRILEKMLVDSYPKIRQASCQCAEHLACTIPKAFYNQSNKLVKPILQSFNHQHFRMRVAAIKALEMVVRYGNTKNLASDEVFGALAERLFDSTPTVRSTVARVIGDWLVNLYDRYSFFRKMIPLMLTSLCDELPELRQEAWELWSKAGLQFEDENEQELKEKMDFYYDKPDHYPPNVERPNLGCRTLVQRNTCQITPALCRELEDWKDDIRIKSAQLLCWLVLHAETDITQHTEGLLVTMYKVCNQKDRRIVENVEKAAEYIAYFVPPSNYVDLLLPTLQDICTPGHLCVLAALVQGSQPDLLLPHSHALAEFLSRDDICRNRDVAYQVQLLRCIEGLLTACGKQSEDIASHLFAIIITVRAVASEPSIADSAKELFQKLALTLDICEQDLYKRYMGLLLNKMDSTVTTWTNVSYDKAILHVLLLESGEIIGEHLAHIALLLKSAMTPESDATMLSKLFILVAQLLTDRHLVICRSSQEIYHQFLSSFILETICPNLVWHAGRTAEALRTVVMACLCSAILPPRELQTEESRSVELTVDVTGSNFEHASPDLVEKLFKDLFPLLVNSIEDSAVKTRLYSVKAMQGLMLLACKRNMVTPDHVNSLYPVLAKRLDDVNDDVRKAAVRSLTNLYSSLPSNYDPRSFQPHLESLFSTLLIHLDDPDPDFQLLMFDALCAVGKVTPQVLHDKLQATQSRFRNCQLCDKLMTQLKALAIT